MAEATKLRLDWEFLSFFRKPKNKIEWSEGIRFVFHSTYKAPKAAIPYS